MPKRKRIMSNDDEEDFFIEDVDEDDDDDDDEEDDEDDFEDEKENEEEYNTQSLLQNINSQLESIIGSEIDQLFSQQIIDFTHRDDIWNHSGIQPQEQPEIRVRHQIQIPLWGTQHTTSRRPVVRSDLSLLIDPDVLLGRPRYTTREYNEALRHFISLGGMVTTPHIRILNMILDYQYDEVNFPSRQQLIERAIAFRCDCLNEYTINQVRMVFEYYIFTRGNTPDCNEFDLAIEYYTLHRVFPSEQEMQDFLINQLTFSNDPVQFANRDRIHTPVLNVQNLPRKQLDSEEAAKLGACGICQNDFKDGDMCIFLEPCKHPFHSVEKDCLETSTVLDWLAEHNFCPMCKTKVEASNKK